MYFCRIFATYFNMKEKPIFFIAILPSAELQKEVTALKQYIADTWGPRHALKSPPHITLYPPFVWSAERQSTLLQCLRAFAQKQHSFWIILDNFGAFDQRVFFIKPETSSSLLRLQIELKKALEQELKLNSERANRPFHPHMTLAHRDVKPEVFRQIWAAFQQRSFQRAFEVCGLALLEWQTEHWVVRQEFPFSAKKAK